MNYLADDLFKKFEEDVAKEKAYLKSRKGINKIKQESSLVNDVLWFSSYYLFKMKNVTSFIKKELSDYIQEERHDEKYGCTRFFIDINRLEKHCLGEVSSNLCRFNKIAEFDSSYDLSEGKLDVLEKLEIVVISKVYAALISTWRLKTDIKHDSEENPFLALSKIGCESSKFVMAKTRDEWVEHFPAVPRSFACNPQNRKYFDFVKAYSNSMAMLLDLIINESLGGKNKEITFIYPTARGSVASKTYKEKSWDFFDTFCDLETDDCFKLVLFEPVGERIPNSLQEKITKCMENTIGADVGKGRGYTFFDDCYACSTSSAQAIGLFEDSIKLDEDFDSYKIGFLFTICDKTECLLFEEVANSCLRLDEDIPNENIANDCLRRLKALRRLNNKVISYTGEKKDVFACLWIQHTLRENFVDDLEALCNYFVEKSQVKRDGKQENMLSVLNILSILTISSVVCDSWSIIADRKPAGLVIFSFMSALALGLAFLVIKLFWNKE